MDTSDAVDLVQVATCSRVLHDLFSDAAVKALHQVAAQRDAAEAARDAAEDARALAEDHRDAAEQARDAAEQELDAARGRIRELELELADAKRARR